MSAFHKQIKQSRWKPLRDAILERDNYTCQVCGRRGIALIAEVDHIQPLHQGGDPYSPANLQAICRSPCHFEKTARERRPDTPENKVRQAKLDAWACFVGELIP